MATNMEMNYKHLIKWIYHNPKIVNVNRFALELNTKAQNIVYYLKSKRPMPKYLIDNITKTFNLTEEQVNQFFYLVKSYKK